MAHSTFMRPAGIVHGVPSRHVQHALPAPAPAPAFLLAASHTHAAKRRLPPARIALDDPSAQVTAPEKTPWYKKRQCAFKDVNNVEELMNVISSTGGKYVAVEFFAGWCGSCKAAFPALCKIPEDAKLSSHISFYKANVEEETLFWFIKKNQVSGLPHLAIFSPSGQQLAGLSSSFKKISQVKQALHTVIDNPSSTRFGLNPQGDLEPRD